MTVLYFPFYAEHKLMFVFITVIECNKKWKSVINILRLIYVFTFFASIVF